MTTYLGLYVKEVNEEGTGSLSGLRISDVIIQYNNMKIESIEAFNQYLTDNLDKQILLVVLRNDTITYVTCVDANLGISCSTTIATTSEKVISNPTSQDILTSSAKADVKIPQHVVRQEQQSSFLIGLLTIIAYASLILGILAALFVFKEFGYIEIGLRSKQLSPVGLGATLAIILQSIIVFTVLQVLATIASDVKELKRK